MQQNEPGFIRQVLSYILLAVMGIAGVLFFVNPENPYFKLAESVFVEKVWDPVDSIPQQSESPSENIAEGPATVAPIEANPDVPLKIEPKRTNEDVTNEIPLEYADQSFSAQNIIEDKLNLLPQEFKIQDGLKKRVGFWLDIYTKYSSHFVLLHDARKPWLIYKVVDLRSIYDSKANRFAKDIDDHKTLNQARFQIKSALIHLAHKSIYTKLNPQEYELYKILENEPGSRRGVFTDAVKNLREQRGQKDFFKKGLISSSLYLNEMEVIFAKYDLPVELTRLPLVESSFNLGAESKVGASGVWQFMANMGKHYLRMSSIVDERNSPIKATDAAAKLMLSNFKLLHSWPLAITAYNHGGGGVARGCKKIHSTSISDLVEKYRSKSFSFASQNFYSEFLGALYGEKYQTEIFGDIPKYHALEAESIDLKYSMRAKTLASITGVTVEEIKLFNPDLKAQAVAAATFLPVGYHIRLPVGHKAPLELFNQEAQEARDYVSKLSHRKMSKI